MQVPKIQSAVERFPEWLSTEEALSLRPVWETQQNWQNHFNEEAKNLADVYDAALDSKTNRRHYRRSGYDPKRSMLKIMRHETEFVREAFRDLLNEERDLDGRAQRFVFYINELFNRFRDANPKDHTPDHYHNDEYGIVSLYLTCAYPPKYAPYSTFLLQSVCRKLGAKEVPIAPDLVRYTKLLSTLRHFLTDDEATMKAYNDFLRSVDYAGESALLVWAWFKMLEHEEKLGIE